MKKLLKIILIVFVVQGLGMVLFFSVLLGYSSYIKSQGINKSEIEILEDVENITQTVIFRRYGGGYSKLIFKANYKNKEQLFYSGGLDDKEIWEYARIIDVDASGIFLTNKKIKDDVYIEKYQEGNVDENLVCFSKNGSYYGFNVMFAGWTKQFIGEFEIEVEDLTDLYIDRQENMDIVNPDYGVLNYGTFKRWSPYSVDYDYFYFVSSRAVYIYDGETAELYKTIEVDSDIYGVSYGESGGEDGGEKLLIAVKDEKQFKVMEYIIE